MMSTNPTEWKRHIDDLTTDEVQVLDDWVRSVRVPCVLPPLGRTRVFVGLYELMFGCRGNLQYARYMAKYTHIAHLTDGQWADRDKAKANKK